MANIKPLNSESSLTVTDFVPAPTVSDGEAQHWYIVTYWSCVLVFPALLPFLSTLMVLRFGGLHGAKQMFVKSRRADVGCV